MGPSAGNVSAYSQDLKRNWAVVIALQTEAETQGPNSTPPDSKNDAKSAEAPQGVEPSVAPTWHARPRSSNRFHFVLLAAMLLIAVGVGWSAGRYFHMATAPAPAAQEVNIDAVVDQIIKVESNGDANAKNKRSSATGLGQFLNETWLLLIRAHRPDLVTERTEAEVLDLRRDPSIAREITARPIHFKVHIRNAEGEHVMTTIDGEVVDGGEPDMKLIESDRSDGPNDRTDGPDGSDDGA